MTLLFIGTTELLLIGGIALLLFGGKKLPEMMKGLGKGVKSFKEGMNETTEKEQETSDPTTDEIENRTKDEKPAETVKDATAE